MLSGWNDNRYSSDMDQCNLQLPLSQLIDFISWNHEWTSWGVGRDVRVTARIERALRMVV